MAGAVGVVIDGPATGSSKFREYDLPAWTRGTSAITCHPYGMGGAINIPVSVGGAVVLPPGDVTYLARMALDRQAKSLVNLDRIRAGENQGERLGLSERIRAGVEGERKLRETYSR